MSVFQDYLGKLEPGYGKRREEKERAGSLLYPKQAWVAAGATWGLERWRQQRSWERPFTLPGLAVVA